MAATNHTSAGDKERSAAAHPARVLLSLLRFEWPEIKVILVFAAGGALLSLGTPIAVDAFLSNVTFGTLVQPLVILTAGLLGSFVLAGAFQALQSLAIEIIQRRLFVRVARDFAQRLTSVKREVFDQAHGPELVNRFLEVVTIQKKSAELLLYAVNTVLATGVGMVVVSLFHPALMGFVLVLLVLIFFVVFVMGLRALPTAVAESAAKYEVLAWLEDLVREEVTFTTGSGGSFALQRADALCQSYLKHRNDHFRVLFRQILGALGIQAFAATAVLGVGGWLVINQQLTPGQLVASELIVSAIAINIGKLGSLLAAYYDVCAAADKLNLVLTLPQERTGGEPPSAGMADHRIEVVDLCYSYHDQHEVLSHVNLVIEAGERLSVSGLHGAGISTLLELLVGRRTPTSGYITFGGVDLRQLDLRLLRESIVLVRGAEIFAGSVADNLSLGRSHISSEEVRRVLELVDLWDPLMRLPQGLQTRLDTGAPTLSSSEALRLTLARAMLHKPRVLLLDNALDGLDAHLREWLTSTLLDPQNQWTVVLASEHLAPQSACTRHLELPPPRLLGAIATPDDSNPTGA
jgi:putative ABC transport system ATP-binding protein